MLAWRAWPLADISGVIPKTKCFCHRSLFLSIRIRWQALRCCFQQLESYVFQEAMLDLSLVPSMFAKTRQAFNLNDNKYIKGKLIDATFRRSTKCLNMLTFCADTLQIRSPSPKARQSCNNSRHAPANENSKCQLQSPKNVICSSQQTH